MNRSIQILENNVAQRIAAGEVIDRPSSALRELLDNAIDAEAKNIAVHLSSGGIDEIRVIDDGNGMGKEDMELCWLPHATSKIKQLEDLDRIYTLGFRGEALSSLAACSQLEIISNTGSEAYSISVNGGNIINKGPTSGAPGTTVSVRNIFHNMPARRHFLKSTRAESSMCRRIFLEKASAHPHINFRFFVDEHLKFFLPQNSYLERVLSCWPSNGPKQAWWETSRKTEDVDITIIHASPHLNRKDRQFIHIYVNHRRVDEYSLLQAVIHAYDSHMPGGLFPMAFVFIDIEPQHVDFNIHPAKKEVRFHNPSAIRHLIIDVTRSRLASQAVSQESIYNLSNYQKEAKLPLYSNENPRPNHSPASYRSREDLAGRFTKAARDIREQSKDTEFCYLGQAMGVFLLAERDQTLFIVDQHAAHERILFDRFRTAEPIAEKLLIPRPLQLDEKAAMRTELRMERLKKTGVTIERSNEGVWQIIALPLCAKAHEDEIVRLIEESAEDPESLEKEFWANLACKAAVKDNMPLDEEGAIRLLTEVFNLELPRCPHGRPIWFEISRKELFELLGRTI